jgi:CBS domain-containing protein
LNANKVRPNQSRAKDLTKKAITLEPDQTLYDVRNILLRYNISRVVVSKDNKPLGIITEKDIARFLSKEVPNRRLNEITLSETMSKDLKTVGEQTSLSVCARMMLESKISSDAVILTGRHSLLSFEMFKDLQHTCSRMKYYNTELESDKSDENILKRPSAGRI